MRKTIKNEKGITLIALVITIIVLLIIAGVTIGSITGDNGIIKKAVEAKEQTEIEEVKEKINLILLKRNKGIRNNKNGFEEYLINELDLKYGIQKNEDSTYSFEYDEWQVIVDKYEVINIEKTNLKAEKVYASVKKMQEDTSLTAGKLVRTEGYHDKKYGGSAFYDIVSETDLPIDNGKCILLDNGLYALIHIINNTVTVNQFGAYGNGENDDAIAINLAINSGYKYIKFESEKYKINSEINIENSNIKLIGNNSNLEYDNDFVFNDDYIIRIYNSNTVCISDIEIKELNVIDKNSINSKEILMLKLMNVENIVINKCTLKTNNSSNSQNNKVTNIDLRIYWKNIEITECNLINETYGPAGGSIWMRAGKAGTGDIKICNNYIKKSCHDESVSVFENGVVENITISNNTFDIDDTNVSQLSYPVFEFGLDTQAVKNIQFLDNKINIIAGGCFLGFDNVEKAVTKNNTFNITSLSSLEYVDFFIAKESTEVNFESNYLKITSTSVKNSVIFNNYNNVSNNEIEINADMIDFCRNVQNIENNTITFNNEMGINGASSIFKYNEVLSDVNVYGNILDFNKKSTKEMRLINMYNGKINNHKINIKNNIIKGVEDQPSQFYIYFQGMKDTTPQEVYFNNNQFSFFTKFGLWDNTTTYSVVNE